MSVAQAEAAHKAARDAEHKQQHQEGLFAAASEACQQTEAAHNKQQKKVVRLAAQVRSLMLHMQLQGCNHEFQPSNERGGHLACIDGGTPPQEYIYLQKRPTAVSQPCRLYAVQP